MEEKLIINKKDLKDFEIKNMEKIFGRDCQTTT